MQAWRLIHLRGCSLGAAAPAERPFLYLFSPVIDAVEQSYLPLALAYIGTTSLRFCYSPELSLAKELNKIL